MPAAIAPFFVSAFGFSAAAASVAASVTVAVVSTAAQVGLQSILAPKRKREAQEYQIKETINAQSYPEFRIYGRDVTGGVLFFNAAQSPDLYRGIILGSGVIDGIEQVDFFDTPITLENGEVKNPQFTYRSEPMARMEFRLGYVDDEASTILKEAFDTWTDDYTLPEIPYAVTRFTLPRDQQAAQDMWRGQVPPQRFHVRGSPVFDMRKTTHDILDPNTFEFSQNTALIGFDYLFNKRGRGLTPAILSVSHWSLAADYCDNLQTSLAGLAPAFQCGGEYSVGEEPVNVISAILGTMGGRLQLLPNAQLAPIYGPANETPFRIENDWIIAREIAPGKAVFEAYNALDVFYTSPQHGYSKQPAGKLRRQDLIDLIGSEKSREFYNDMIQSQDQALRVAWQRLHEDNPAVTGELTLTSQAIGVLFTDDGSRRRRLVEIENPFSGEWEVMEIEGIALASDVSSIRLSFKSYAPEAYEFSPVEEGFTLQAVPPVYTEGVNAPVIAQGVTDAVMVDIHTDAQGVADWQAGTAYSQGDQVVAPSPVDSRRYVWTADTARPDTVTIFDTSEAANWTQGARQVEDIQALLSWDYTSKDVARHTVEWRKFGTGAWTTIPGTDGAVSSVIWETDGNFEIGDIVEFRINRFSRDGVESGYAFYNMLVADDRPFAIDPLQSFTATGREGGYGVAFTMPDNPAVTGYQITKGDFDGAEIVRAAPGQPITLSEEAAEGAITIKARPVYLDGQLGSESNTTIDVLAPQQIDSPGGFDAGNTGDGAFVGAAFGPSVNFDGYTRDFDTSGPSTSGGQTSSSDGLGTSGVSGLF